MDIGTVVAHVKTIHDRERALIATMDEDSARAPSSLPRWTRAHVLSCRMAFLRAALRQVDYALAGKEIEFYDGGKPGREAEIEAHANRPGDWLVSQVEHTTTQLDDAWARLTPAEWEKRANYREPSNLISVLYGSWREAEIHCVDYDLGVEPAGWSDEFCYHLFAFLTPRVPAGIRIELAPSNGQSTVIGAGHLVIVRGALTDLAAWLAGRTPAGRVESSNGLLPPLQGLRGGESSPRAS
ncbi:maleylpyruvate isomerase family mycothiol-dependent enzyme [Nocardia nepalensis]|uniref:maleylpyruvate isomerase family mycothiol-dependent enzyme n=1 Tax=Nocardia nepalensis TaxID=3375448 RepID=UPI003B68464C